MLILKYIKESVKYILRCPFVIRPYIREVERLYAMTPEDLMKRNERRFLDIFRRAYDKSPFYRRLYMERGIRKEDIAGLKDIQKLPVVTKEMVKRHGLEMLTVPRWSVVKGNTSGTTGTPLSVYSNWPAIWRAQAYTYCSRKRDGFIYGQRLVSLRGHLDKQDLSLRIHVSNTLYLSSYNINSAHAQFYYDSITRFHPVAIEGYPSSLYALALILRDAGLKLNIPVTFTSSETLLDYQRSLIERQFNTQIFDRYSMTEMSIYLIETYNHTGYYEAPGFSINEYVTDGEICTSLINEAFPLIRYRSDDIIEMSEFTDEYPSAIVKKIVGRMDDYIVCKDGSIVSRIDFIENGAHIKACQWIQSDPGAITILIVPDDEFSEDDRLFVIRETERKVGQGNLDIDTSVVPMEKLIYSRRGKFKLIVNNIGKVNESA